MDGEIALEFSQCILPIANKKTSYELPSHGLAYDVAWVGGACGTIVLGRYSGCLNVSEHSQVTLDGTKTNNKIAVKPVKRNCGRFECPVCYQTWVAKSAKRIEYRLYSYEDMRRSTWKGYKLYAKHITVSVPKKHYIDLELRMSYYKKNILSMLKKVGVEGGAFIYHPYRWKCWECGTNRKMGRKTCSKCEGVSFEQYFSPHFHILGLGWIEGNIVKEIHIETGYIIKHINSGKRNIFRTAQYQLSHCAKKEGGRAFTWFGTLSYVKFKAKPYRDMGEPCPICGVIMIPLKYVGKSKEPLEGLEEYRSVYLDDAKDWVSLEDWKGIYEYDDEKLNLVVQF